MYLPITNRGVLNTFNYVIGFVIIVGRNCKKRITYLANYPSKIKEKLKESLGNSVLADFPCKKY